MRWIRHLLSRVNRHFPPATMDAIRNAIANSERRQLGEIVFAVEGRLSFTDLWHGRQARDCAIEAFSKLRVWDTEGNSGVLIYLLLADHAIEIVADRGIARHVPDSDWQAVCGDMRQRLAGGDFEGGVIAGIEAIRERLDQHLPGDNHANPNELPDRPIVL